MDITQIIYKIALYVPGFLFALVIHEWSHARMAKKYGDNTAEIAGRLSFNPVVHVDPIGTFLFPMVLIAFGSGVFGWAKPVPVDPRNFKKFDRGFLWEVFLRPFEKMLPVFNSGIDKKMKETGALSAIHTLKERFHREQGQFWVSFAGPLSNFICSIILSFILVLVLLFVPATFDLKNELIQLLQFAVQFNVIFGTFNLIPLPPLDGSGMLMAFLSRENQMKFMELQRYTFFILIGLYVLESSGLRTVSYFYEFTFSLSRQITIFIYGIFA